MGQESNIVIRIMDALSAAPLSHAFITDKDGRRLAESDSLGYCALPFVPLTAAEYLLALKPGYEPDTIRNGANVIYLEPISQQMGTAIVRGNKVSRLFREPDLYVVDYLFAEDRILVAAYRGNNGSKAGLYLINREGGEVAECKLPEEPLYLYKSCIGNMYCVCREQFYPVVLTGAAIRLKAPYPVKLLSGLRQCDLSVGGNQFYRIVDRVNFKVSFGVIAKGDSVYRPLMQFDESKKGIFTLLDYGAANASYEEYADILDFWSGEAFHEAYRRNLMRKKLDLAAIAHINVPLYTTGDSVLIFDYYNKRILFYNQFGKPTGSGPVRFEWKQSQQFEIIKDEGLDRLYLHRYSNKSSQTVEELDVTTGNGTGKRAGIERPFAELVKINNGDIYFLWQDGKAGGTRQLYVQHE